MKAKSILAALLLLVAGLQTAWGQKMIVTLNDNSQVTYSISQVREVTFVEADEPVNDEHEYVDLGLPSGTKWATCNVGASKPEEYGDYFAWGETTTKSYYDWSTYKWCNGSETTMTKYCTRSGYGYNGFTDNLTELQPEDDAATANWGSGWRMPSNDQIHELRADEYTTWEWTQLNGVYGYKITSKSNGNSIFLPAAGFREEDELYSAGSYGYYWSSSRDYYDYFAYDLSFSSGGWDWYDSASRRYNGQPVRAVRVSSALPAQLVTSITLSQTSLSLEVGKTQTLTAAVLPSNATNKAVAWTSSNTSVATVSTSGMVTAKASGTCTITCSATDGSGVKATCQVTVSSSGQQGNHDYVDLGLPSGTLWATCNVGASKPEEYGDYFAWGETTPKSTYDLSTYKWCKGDVNTMTKYCTRSEYGYNGFTDNLTKLQPGDDAATANWGSGKMPSFEQINELINDEYTTWEWTQLNGVNGRKVTSKSNGNSIFLPAAGDRWDGELNDAGLGLYWSSSLYPDDDSYAYALGFDSGYWNWFDTSRSIGFSVRAVRVP